MDLVRNNQNQKYAQLPRDDSALDVSLIDGTVIPENGLIPKVLPPKKGINDSENLQTADSNGLFSEIQPQAYFEKDYSHQEMSFAKRKWQRYLSNHRCTKKFISLFSLS